MYKNTNSTMYPSPLKPPRDRLFPPAFSTANFSQKQGKYLFYKSRSTPSPTRLREGRIDKTAKGFWKYLSPFCADRPLTVDNPSGIVSSTNARTRSSKRGKPFQRSVGWCKTRRCGIVELAAERLCRRSSRCRRERPLQCRDMIVSYRVIPFFVE